MRTVTRLPLLALLLVGLAACAFRDTVTSHTFGDGYRLQVSWEHRAIWDWDDVPEPHLVYDVTRNGESWPGLPESESRSDPAVEAPGSRIPDGN